MFTNFVTEATARGRCLPQRRVRRAAADGTGLIAGLFGDHPDARRVLIFWHGAGANMNVGYLDLARDIAAAQDGTAVIVPDMRGHGRSSGMRGHVQARTLLWSDVGVWRAFARERYPRATEFLGGHSAGAALCLNHLRDAGDLAAPAGLILLAPYLGAMPGRHTDENLAIRGFSSRDASVFMRYMMSRGADAGTEIALNFDYPPEMARLNELVSGYTPEMAIALTPSAAREALAAQRQPTLMIAAREDALFAAEALRDFCTDAAAVEYRLAEGDHLTCLYRAGPEIAAWMERHDAG